MPARGMTKVCKVIGTPKGMGMGGSKESTTITAVNIAM